MRILYHHRTLGDGAEGIHIAAMVEAFRDLGHDVRVLGFSAGARGARQSLVERIRDAVPSAAFEVASIGVNLPEYHEVTREIRQFNPDFLYKRYARYDLAALTAAQRLGVHSVLEVNALFTGPLYHQFEPMFLRGIARRMEQRALAMAGTVLAVSTPLQREINALVSRTITVMPNGVNPQRFDPSRADAARIRVRHDLRDGVTIGWAGVIREWHGLELLLDALEEIPDAVLLIVGDGPGRFEFERRIESLGLTHRVVITGRVAHDEMPDYLAAIDVAAVAHDRTGIASPMKLLEYMAMGRATVAPRLDNIVDVIDDGVDALLFEPGNPRSLADAVRRLIEDEDLRASLGRNARTKVLRERNWRANAELVVSLARQAQLTSNTAEAL